MITVATVVNPARAGMIRRLGVGCACHGGKPRASGDDPQTALYREAIIE